MPNPCQFKGLQHLHVLGLALLPGAPSTVPLCYICGGGEPPLIRWRCLWMKDSTKYIYLYANLYRTEE